MIKKRILLVNDETDFCADLEARLKNGGYEVIIVHDGQNALKTARKERPDLIILDAMLPIVDGYKVCRMLKFDAKHKSIPIILVSAKRKNIDEKLAYEVGADFFMTKPLESRVLLEKTTGLLEE